MWVRTGENSDYTHFYLFSEVKENPETRGVNTSVSKPQKPGKTVIYFSSLLCIRPLWIWTRDSDGRVHRSRRNLPSPLNPQKYLLNLYNPSLWDRGVRRNTTLTLFFSCFVSNMQIPVFKGQKSLGTTVPGPSGCLIVTGQVGVDDVSSWPWVPLLRCETSLHLFLSRCPVLVRGRKGVSCNEKKDRPSTVCSPQWLHGSTWIPVDLVPLWRRVTLCTKSP